MIVYEAVENGGKAKGKEHPEVMEPETIILIIDIYPTLHSGSILARSCGFGCERSPSMKTLM